MSEVWFNLSAAAIFVYILLMMRVCECVCVMVMYILILICNFSLLKPLDLYILDPPLLGLLRLPVGLLLWRPLVEPLPPKFGSSIW